MGLADLHIHTIYSYDGTASVPAVLTHAKQIGLDVIAITDHEDALGGLLARDLAVKRGYRFEVIVGAEITTLQGHVLALFVEQTPPSFRRVESTLEMIHTQGGLAVAPHPLSWLTRSLGARTLNRLAGANGPRFDAIELGNPSPAGLRTASKARSMRSPARGNCAPPTCAAKNSNRFRFSSTD